MKNPMAIMAALARGFSDLLKGKEAKGYTLRRDPHARYSKRPRTVSKDGLCKGASYNRTFLRLWRSA